MERKINIKGEKLGMGLFQRVGDYKVISLSRHEIEDILKNRNNEEFMGKLAERLGIIDGEKNQTADIINNAEVIQGSDTHDKNETSEPLEDEKEKRCVIIIENVAVLGKSIDLSELEFFNIVSRKLQEPNRSSGGKAFYQGKVRERKDSGYKKGYKNSNKSFRRR